MINIKPSDIDVEHGIWDSIWQNKETEASAYWLVKLAQSKGDWLPFTKKEIDDFCGEDFWFNLLRNGWSKSWIEEISKVNLILVDCPPYVKNGSQYTQELKEVKSEVTYHYTDDFIKELYRTNKIK